MTRSEFHRWIEARGAKGSTHYEELLAVARLRTSADAEDVLHNAFAGMLDSDELDRRSPETVWPWAVGMVRGMAHTARRGRQRAESALGRAGSLLYDTAPAQHGTRAWFLGPHCWRQVVSRRDPRLRPPRPDEPFGEHRVQPGAPCRTCGAMTVYYLNAGRDYDKWLGRERVSYLSRRCLNGHSVIAERRELEVQ